MQIRLDAILLITLAVVIAAGDCGAVDLNVETNANISSYERYMLSKDIAEQIQAQKDAEAKFHIEKSTKVKALNYFVDPETQTRVCGAPIGGSTPADEALRSKRWACKIKLYNDTAHELLHE